MLEQRPASTDLMGAVGLAMHEGRTQAVLERLSQQRVAPITLTTYKLQIIIKMIHPEKNFNLELYCPSRGQVNLITTVSLFEERPGQEGSMRTAL